MRYYKVCHDAENECACNGGESNLAEVNGESADTADKNYGNYEEISVFAEVYFLNHFKTAYRDKAVECDTDTADYAGRYGFYEYYQRIEEGNYYADYCG